jgi:DNA-binding response OmpR family regulator
MKRARASQPERKPVSLPLKTILLVYEPDEIRIALKWFLTISGYVVDSVRNAEEAIAVFDPIIHDMVVTGDSMLDMTGRELAHVIKLRSASTPIIMYASHLPDDSSCLDGVVDGSLHMVVLKTEMERILMAHSL